MAKKKTFILSDQSVNCYGFVVLTAGIVIEGFLKNPVMLYNHVNTDNPEEVIGKWTDIYTKGTQLLGTPDIDQEDERALKVSKKVDAGYINAASISLNFKSDDVKFDVPGFEGIAVITKCELKEVSLVAIPGNSNAVRLIADGKEINDNSFALSLSEKLKTDINEKPTTMKKVLLFAAALGIKLKEDATEDHVLEAVTNVCTERDNLKLKLKEYEDKEKENKTKNIESLMEYAYDKKLFAKGSEEDKRYRKLADTSFEDTEAIIKKMVPHKTITEQLGGGKDVEKKNPFEGKTFKELMKTDEGAKYISKLKAENKEAHKALWQESFPNGTYNA